MQYRRDTTADWEDLGDVWVKRPKADPHPERWNVQMVAIGTTGKVTLNGRDPLLTADRYRGPTIPRHI